MTDNTTNTTNDYVRRRKKNIDRNNNNENDSLPEYPIWRDEDFFVFSKKHILTRDDLFSCNVIRPHSKQIVALESYDEIVRNIELREAIIDKLLVALNCEKFRNDPIGYTKQFSKYVRFGTLWKYVALILERILSDQYMQFGDVLYYRKDVSCVVSKDTDEEVISCLLYICNNMDTSGYRHDIVSKASSIYQDWKNKNNQNYSV